jgi:hypothetical protein
MGFGTFQRVTDENPMESDSGDAVLGYESEDGHRVRVIMTHRGSPDPSAFGGPVTRNEYALVIEGPRGAPEPPRPRFAGEQFLSKPDAADAAKRAVEWLVERGHGSW